MSSPYCHPVFTGVRREKVLYIERSLRDVYPKTVEEWEEGFRCDWQVEQELGLWVRLARCLAEFTERNNATLEERNDAFQVLAVCMNSTSATVVERLSLRGLDRNGTQELAASFFCR